MMNQASSSSSMMSCVVTLGLLVFGSLAVCVVGPIITAMFAKPLPSPPVTPTAVSPSPIQPPVKVSEPKKPEPEHEPETVPVVADEPKHDATIEQRKHEAERKLKLIKPFIDRGEDKIAIKRLTEIIEHYSDTPASEQAQEMLKKLHR